MCAHKAYNLAHFNPLHREGGDQEAGSKLSRDMLFQSTPPRGWRRPHGWIKAVPMDISIHSTARVETPFRVFILHYLNISIHSTARVETSSSPRRFPATEFQSTPPRGWRQTSRAKQQATGAFQSTPPRGWRPQFVFPCIGHLLFQSTPPRGWRRSLISVIIPKQSISIHSTARVETQGQLKDVERLLFQSTPPRGWRHRGRPYQRNHNNFNPLHREGGDGFGILIPCRTVDFNPLHREGGDSNTTQ